MKCYACDNGATGGAFRLDGSTLKLVRKGSKLKPGCERHATIKRMPKTA